MSDHAKTALDQLRLADSCANSPDGDAHLTRSDEHLGFLAKAVVHALLDIAAAMRATDQVVDEFAELVKDAAEFKPPGLGTP